MNERPYITERTKTWRNRGINSSFAEAIDVIETHGCQIMGIKADLVIPSFAYTTGVFDNSGKPELITVGLSSSVSHFALNESVRRMRQGIDLMRGRHRGIVGDVEVEFHLVDSKWLHHVMLRTDWFYEHTTVPVLQLIYPDLKNRFPNDPAFDHKFAQPSLSGEEFAHGTITHDFWAAHDLASSLCKWKFPDRPHTGAYLSQTVFNKEEPITYVSHDTDGDWQFLGDRMSLGGGPVLCCLHHPVDEDPTLADIADLPLGWYATRYSPEEPWQRFEHPPEDHNNAQSPRRPLLN